MLFFNSLFRSNNSFFKRFFKSDIDLYGELDLAIETGIKTDKIEHVSALLNSYSFATPTLSILLSRVIDYYRYEKKRRKEIVNASITTYHLIKIMQALIKAGATDYDSSALFKAINLGDIDLIKILLDKAGSDVNMVEEDSRLYPLHRALCLNDSDRPNLAIVQELITHGADVNQIVKCWRWNTGQTPLDFFAMYTFQEPIYQTDIYQTAIVQVLVEAGAIDYDSKYLYRAIRLGAIDMVKILLDKARSDVNKMEKYTGFYPLHLALFRNGDRCYPELVQELIARGADVNQRVGMTKDILGNPNSWGNKTPLELLEELEQNYLRPYYGFFLSRAFDSHEKEIRRILRYHTYMRSPKGP